MSRKFIAPFRRRVTRPGWAALGVMLGVGFGAAGIAAASIPDSGGVIHGCYSKASGTNGPMLTSAGTYFVDVTAQVFNQSGTNGGTCAVSARDTGMESPVPTAPGTTVSTKR
jgi:hypothetical protein